MMELQTLGAPARMTVRDAIRAGAELLQKAGIDGARLDAEVLLGDVLGVAKAELYLALDAPLDQSAGGKFQKHLLRRAARKPLAYITGHKEFWSLDFIVTPAVLIPRPETELLVELALKFSTADTAVSPRQMLDLGTGSGAIAVSLARELPQARLCAVDISASALEVARLNARRHGVEEQLRFFRGDLFEPLADVSERFDLIVANPPYIRSGDLAGLAPEIRNWEPIAALNGGADGLLFYRRIIGAAGRHLADGGRLLFEIGDGMGEPVRRLSGDFGAYEPAEVYRDYAGKERVVAAVKRCAPRELGKGPNDG